MRLIDADELKKCAIPCEIHNGTLTDMCVPLYQIDNAPTVARTERNFVMIEGKPIYITQGYIDAMIEYERKEQVKEVVERLMNL